MFKVFYSSPVFKGHYLPQLKAKYVCYHHQYTLTLKLKEAIKEQRLGELKIPSRVSQPELELPGKVFKRLDAQAVPQIYYVRISGDGIPGISMCVC